MTTSFRSSYYVKYSLSPAGKKQNFIVLLKSDIEFLKFISCDNQALVGCIPIAVVAVPGSYCSPENRRTSGTA